MSQQTNEYDRGFTVGFTACVEANKETFDQFRATIAQLRADNRQFFLLASACEHMFGERFWEWGGQVPDEIDSAMVTLEESGALDRALERSHE